MKQRLGTLAGLVLLAVVFGAGIASAQVPMVILVDEGDLSQGADTAQKPAEAQPDQTTAVNLHQTYIWEYGYWVDGGGTPWRRYNLRVYNYGSTASGTFTYDFTIDGWYVTSPRKTQNNPINPNKYITFYCLVPWPNTLTSCEMNGYPYYIAPDDIYPYS